MYKSSPEIDTPPDECVVWRYISLEKLISLLHSHSLHFCRLDKLRDPWEGMWPKKLMESISVHLRDLRDVTISLTGEGLPDKPSPSMDEIIRNCSELPKQFFVSCWHENLYESAGFWEHYQHTSGIAIKSTVGRLKQCSDAPRPVLIGRVQYFSGIPSDITTSRVGQFTAAFVKRKSFEHECEVRMLLSYPLLESETAISPEEGIQLPVDLTVLIDSIYISPESPIWVVEPIRELLQRFSLPNVTVQRSDLYDRNVT